MAGSDEETTLFHSIYSCVFVHKPTTHSRQDDLLKGFTYPFVPLLFQTPSTGKITPPFPRYLWQGTGCCERRGEECSALPARWHKKLEA